MFIIRLALLVFVAVPNQGRDTLHWDGCVERSAQQAKASLYVDVGIETFSLQC